jgi:hypothetical protein
MSQLPNGRLYGSNLGVDEAISRLSCRIGSLGDPRTSELEAGGKTMKSSVQEVLDMKHEIEKGGVATGGLVKKSRRLPGLQNDVSQDLVIGSSPAILLDEITSLMSGAKQEGFPGGREAGDVVELECGPEVGGGRRGVGVEGGSGEVLRS